MKAIRVAVLCVMLTLSLTPFAHAAELSVTPFVIDEKAKPRDILKQTITILNTSERRLNLYPSVNDVDAKAGEQAFAPASNADERSASLANWIELSRGVIELGPGEEKVIPFVIRVHLDAEPGDYHAAITFSNGSTREMAEASSPLATIDVNVDVAADVKESIQLNKFFTDRMFFSGDDVLFSLQLENIGNQDLRPKGEIRIYDGRGKEVAALDVNKDGQTISPNQVSQLASAWSAAQGFGRYKAFLNIDYGASQKASVQDTVFFWVVPWPQLLGLLTASVIAVIFLSLYVHHKLELRHEARLAHALAHHGVAPVADVAPTEPKLSKIGAWLTRRRQAREEAALLERKKPRWSEHVASVAETPPAPQKREVVVPPTQHPHTKHSIDLSKLSAHTPEKKSTAHVINLKERS